ncbi:haloacid dehalogenase [Enterococcus florum]|uniref:Haloacid dehalogenase n=1 Tax=Enterococcus florum TaxID=2480627 RepID=A0A4P5P9R3_9ENTE|nr:HAD family hydrolase [Enterococcus florum]GCF94835.1 haloacid dehalogenase [Enterococcus florum]
MTIKMVVCDLDNTLLNEEGRVSKENLAAIHSLMTQGGHFVAASGRTINQMEQVLVNLGTINRENCYSITMNGGVVIENKKNRKLAHSYFTYRELYQLFAFAQREGVCLHFQTDELIYLFHPSAAELKYLDTQQLDYVVIEEDQLTYLKNEKVGKVLYQHDDIDYLKDLSVILKDYCEGDLTISYSANRYMEINCGRDISKAQGIKLLAGHLKISLTEVLAIGDNYNDLEMVELAGFSACPSNAIAELRQHCDYISKKSCNQHAVADILSHYRQINQLK